MADRNRTTRKRSGKAGMPPGTLVHVGEKRTEAVRITYIDYDELHFQEKEILNVEECFHLKNTSTTTWINIDGIHNVDIIEKIGGQFDLHPLIMEDVLNTEQRPKFEDYDKYMFIVFKMLSYNDEKQKTEIEQVSVVLGQNFVISFQERVGDVFEQIRDRIRNAKGRIRKAGPDYLAYSLLDAIVDNYFSILERIGEKIEFLEEQLVKDPTEQTIRQIHLLKREMIILRKSVWPLREVISGLQRTESRLIEKSTSFYLRDVYDHTIQIMDTIESSRDMISGMVDLYLSSLSNKMNSVMKVLTIIATIFIPLTFIAGVYGMNFRYMPETDCRWGYPAAWLVMIIVAVVMLIYFRKKKWI